MNKMSMEYHIKKYGVVDAAITHFSEDHVVQMHVAMIKTHEEALKKLLLSMAEDDDE